MSMSTRSLLILAAILAVVPWLLPNAYYFDLAIRIAINACAAIGLNLLVGYTGQISLGHAGFFGIGAYASAILTTRYGWPPVVAMAAGAAAAALLAVLASKPIFRLRGHFLAMATLGLGFIISIVAATEAAWTGGPDGISIDSLSVLGFTLSGDWAWYGAVAVLLLLMTWLAGRLIDAPAGRALQAIHGSEIAARVAGIDVISFKTRVFALSAALTSVMGSVTAHYVGLVTPGVAGFLHSIELVTMVVVGGMASIYGSVVGAVLLTALPQLLSAFEGWETVVYGLILVLTMMFLPRGVVPSLRLAFANRRK